METAHTRPAVVRLLLDAMVCTRDPESDAGNVAYDALVRMFGDSRGLARTFAAAVGEACQDLPEKRAWELLADVMATRLADPATLIRNAEILSERLGIADLEALAAALRSADVPKPILATLFVISVSLDWDEATRLVDGMGLDDERLTGRFLGRAVSALDVVGGDPVRTNDLSGPVAIPRLSNGIRPTEASMQAKLDRNAISQVEGLSMSADGDVICDLSAREWGLFASSIDCAEARDALNEATGKAVSEGADLAAAVWPVMQRYRVYGASDSEPVNVLKGIYLGLGGNNVAFHKELLAAMEAAEPSTPAPGR